MDGCSLWTEVTAVVNIRQGEAGRRGEKWPVWDHRTGALEKHGAGRGGDRAHVHPAGPLIRAGGQHEPWEP